VNLIDILSGEEFELKKLFRFYLIF